MGWGQSLELLKFYIEYTYTGLDKSVYFKTGGPGKY